MRKLTILTVAALFAVALLAASLRAGAAAETSVAVAGSGLFPADSGAELFGVNLDGSTFGAGVVVAPDGSAIGDFHILLTGSTALGAAQTILVEGTVQTGSSSAAGAVTFGGLGRVETGGQMLSDVPFTVAMTTSGIALTLGGTSLPTQTLTEGGILIQ